MNDFRHVYAICVYQELEYIESCIRSLKRQTVQSSIIMTMPTPNLLIEWLAKSRFWKKASYALETRIMFRKFWPEWIVRFIMHFYKRAYNTYN